jgi:glutamate dehydrogenase (NAD(P)+)
MLKTTEQATGRTCTDDERATMTKGPDEQDLVNSGLEETMISAFHDLLKTQRQTKGIPDLRIAAFVSAIHKVARSYMELGIFP